MQKIASLLPYRPRPHKEENLQGYTLRLASWYGYKNHTTFAKNVFGCTLPRYLEAETTPGTHWQEFLESALRIRPGEIDPDWAYSQDSQHTLRSSKLISDVKVRPPRLCEQCVANNGRFKKEWQIAHHLVCEQHCSPLLDCCPKCEKPFIWERSIFKGCKTCGYEWNADRPRSTPTYELLTDIQSASCAESLYSAFLHALNIGGHTNWPQNRITFDPKTHHKMMLTAYGLVLSKQFNERTVEDFAGRGASNLSAIGSGLAALKEKRLRNLADDESVDLPESLFLTDIFPQPDAYDLWQFVPPKHRKFSNRCNANDLADSTTVSELLGITVQNVNQLVDSGFIECLGDTPVLRDRVYSLERLNSQVETLFESAEKSEIPCSALDRSRALRVLRRFGFTSINAIIWAFESKLPFWISPNHSLSGTLRHLHYDLTSLVAVCEDEFNRRSDDEVVSRKEAQDIIYISNRALDTVSKLGLLPSKRWSGNGAFFELASVRTFLSKYPTLGRQACISGITPKTMESICPNLFSNRQLLELPDADSSNRQKKSSLVGRVEH